MSPKIHNDSGLILSYLPINPILRNTTIIFYLAYYLSLFHGLEHGLHDFLYLLLIAQVYIFKLLLIRSNELKELFMVIADLFKRVFLIF